MLRTVGILCLSLLFIREAASQSAACAAGSSIQEFRLTVEPPKGGASIPLTKVNSLRQGAIVKYQPSDAAEKSDAKAMISLILVPKQGKTSADPVVLEPRSAARPIEWILPCSASIVGVVFGPQGLDVKKVQSLLENKRQLVLQLADYAEQTSNFGALVETLAAWEKSPSNQGSLNAILSGFSSRYGVSLPRLSGAASADEQAIVLLRGVLPSLSSYDPLTAAPAALVQQSAGLATTMASLFLGSPVTLAEGGAALFQNLRTLMFPDTDFRSAIAQIKNEDQISLCAKPETAKSRTRLAYLWALRLPDSGPPAFALAGNPTLPLGGKPALKYSAKAPAQARQIARVQAWQMVSLDGREVWPVTAGLGGAAADTIQLDLSDPHLPPGDYRLAGRWDWNFFLAEGTIRLRNYGNMETARILPASADTLLEDAGPIQLELAGSDFQFVEKIQLTAAEKPDEAVVPVAFDLPRVKAAEAMQSIRVRFSTKGLSRGAYVLQIAQGEGKTYPLPIDIHPPNPVLRNLPLHANLGESRQTFHLRGQGLDRIEEISALGIEFLLSPAGPVDDPAKEGEREVTLILGGSQKAGESIDIRMKVRELNNAYLVARAIEVVGPRPVLTSAERSFQPKMSIELRQDEIPAGFPVSFSLKARHLSPGAVVELECGQSTARSTLLSIKAGEEREGARLELAGDGMLYLTVDPRKMAGPSGCLLSARVKCDPAGISDAIELGKVVRVPQIDRFELTDERIGESQYVGILTGKNLQTIEKTGWDALSGYAVLGIPSPAAGLPEEQTLRVSLPWPSPAPHSPIFLWLRGENVARSTQVRN
jgi:hypothetical protein